MKNFVIIAMVGAAAAVPSSPVEAERPMVTAKSTEQFAECFAGAQGRLGQAWWFVPRAHGGTFSNLGANGVGTPYFVTISDRGTHRAIRLVEASAAEARTAGSCL